ncbi:MAG: hypothetical protein ACLGIA_00625 [Actinomycetes bacterium]
MPGFDVEWDDAERMDAFFESERRAGNADMRGVTVQAAGEAAADPNRVSKTLNEVHRNVLGYSPSAGAVLFVRVRTDAYTPLTGKWHGVDARRATAAEEIEYRERQRS